MAARGFSPSLSTLRKEPELQIQAGLHPNLDSVHSQNGKDKARLRGGDGNWALKQKQYSSDMG